MKRILVVEDEPDGQELISILLSYADILAERAASAEEALRMLHQDADYDAVVIDLALPGMHGFDLLKTLRAEAETRHMICIAITAYHNSGVRHEALDMGFDAYIPKPLDEETFPQAVARLITA